MKASRFKSTRRMAIAGLAAGGLLLSAGVAVAGPSGLLSQHGGATRLTGDQSAKIKRAVDSGRAQNVILLIGDGHG